MNWINRVKSAFQRLKNLNVKNQEVKQWGVNIATQLLKSLGIDSKAKCPPRTVEYDTNYGRGPPTKDKPLIVEMRVPFCEDKDIQRMEEAVRILATEAYELTPVDTGRLRKSQYKLVFTENNGEVVVGVVGYDVGEVFRESNGSMIFYALAVHNRNANHTGGNNGPRAQWRFLEEAQQNRNIQSQIQDLFA